MGTGCHVQRINDNAEREIDAIHADTESLLFTAECPDGAVLRDKCGLIAARVAMPDFRQTFSEKKCSELTTPQCQELFDRAVTAWTAQRYMLADFGEVEETCDAHPGRCDDPRIYEGLLLTSHNIAVSKIDQRREGDALFRRDVRLALDRQVGTDTVLVGVMATTVVAGTMLPRHHHHW
jgi:hypothetical protein